MIIFASSVRIGTSAWLVREEGPQTRSVMNTTRLKQVHRFRNFPWAVYEGDQAADEGFAKKLKTMNLKAYRTGAMHLARIPNDPNFPLQETFNAPSADADIYLREAWDTQTDASSIVVAVIDSGMDPNHPDLSANLWTNAAEDQGTAGVDDDHNGYVDDVHGWNFIEDNNVVMDSGIYHGTGVCGVIGATGDNGTGMTGVCWKVKIMPLRAFGDLTTSDTIVLSAIDYAMSFPEVRIINASWGGPDGSMGDALSEAIQEAGRRGILVMAAAGNNAVDLKDQPFYPASYPHNNIVSVAAIAPQGGLASFSDYGSTVTLAAPGFDIYTTAANGSYLYDFGTSFATPIVSGAAALLLARQPYLRPPRVRDWLVQTSRHTSSLTGIRLGGGLLNVQALLGGAPSRAHDWHYYP
jgi:subtilisin family serine protease